MSPGRKSTPEDRRLLEDESADPVERASALSRIASDMRRDLETTIADLLHHPSVHLRGDSVLALVGRWQLEQYLDDAVRMLHSDPGWSARTTAATALSMFARHTGKHQDLIIKELAGCLRQDPDPIVQRACYERLLELIAPERSHRNLPDDFGRERDVDWELLKPYIENASNTDLDNEASFKA